MTGDLDRFRFLAAFVAGHPVELAEAPPGQAPYTDRRTVFVSHGADPEQHRREVVLQCALLAAGSLAPDVVRRLRGRPGLARRYLAIEGRRALAELSRRLPLAAIWCTELPPADSSAAGSLDRARRSTAEPPEWFGVIKPSALLSAPAGTTTPARGNEQPSTLSFGDEDDDEDPEPGPPSTILRLFDNPLFNSQAVGDFLRRLLGTSRSTPSSDASSGGELRVGSVRRARKRPAEARPTPTRIHFTDEDRPGAAAGVGGALYPEWDVFRRRYRPDWCRVVDYPLRIPADVTAAAVPRDPVLHRRLAGIGLTPKALRRRPDGDDLDVGALVDLAVDLRCGHSPPENIYTEYRKAARDLGVLILLDASGSATDADPHGMAVHDHQRRAAATLAATLEELGDRVAVYAFRSDGRRAVHLAAIKTFDQRFGAAGRARLNQLRPSGYTRLGAAIRGAGEILKTQAGTTNRLLLVLSDGHAYDHGYAGTYATADTRRALAELRGDGVACLCLSLASDADGATLEKVFGSAGHAHAPSLAVLSPRMDELFLSALRELAVPRSGRGG